MKVRWLAVAVSLLLAPLARAQGPIFLNVGDAKTLKVGRPVISAKSTSSSVLKVRKKTAREVELVGLDTGRSTLVLKLSGSDDLILDVQVSSKGTIIY